MDPGAQLHTRFNSNRLTNVGVATRGDIYLDPTSELFMVFDVQPKWNSITLIQTLSKITVRSLSNLLFLAHALKDPRLGRLW